MSSLLTETDKTHIASQIKNIPFKKVDEEMNKLIQIGKTANAFSPRSRIGNNVVDYFTFPQRLETKGKYDINFFDFIERIEEFKKKKFIQTMLTYYKEVKNKNNTKNDYVVYKEVYNICISAINIMRPLNCMEIYTKYQTKRVLNFCAGWGGSMVAAAALNIDAFYGIEINTDLMKPYDEMIKYLKDKSETTFSVQFCDAATADYSSMTYDTVFASPPYYSIEKYANNLKYGSKREMDDQFYAPAFKETYNGLQKGGHYIINICKEVYENVLKGLLGEAHEIFPLKKSQRQNNYTELVYVWHKN
ncbi:class I SAM-dependent methyltransferase [bacterium]|nr:class I SAM-dependent methyltransferase [bacterium]